MFRKICLLIFVVFSLAISSGCGDDKGSGAAAIREDPIRLVVSFTGALDAEVPKDGAVLAVRTIMPDGSLSQPFASITSFNTSSFLFYDLSVELLKKRAFLVELRDKKPLSKLVWAVRKGHSNIGLLDENSSFISNSVIKFLRTAKTNPENISFFIERTPGETVPGLADYEKNGNVGDLEDSFVKALETWVAAGDETPEFPWDVTKKVKGSLAGKRLGKAVMVTRILEEGDREGRRWLPVVYAGFQAEFLDTLSNEVTGMDWNQERARSANVLLFEIKNRLCPPPEPAKKDSDAEKTTTILETIDLAFYKYVTEDKDYDLRRKASYVIDEIKSCAPYDRDATSVENFNRFIGAYNDSIQGMPVEYGLKDFHYISPEQYRAFEDSVAKGVKAYLEKVKKKTAEKADEKPL